MRHGRSKYQLAREQSRGEASYRRFLKRAASRTSRHVIRLVLREVSR